MTLVWTNRERQATYDRGRWSGTQSYLVRDSADAAVTVYAIASESTNYEIFGGGDDLFMEGYMRFVSATYSPVADAMDKIWNVVFSFESTTGDGANATAIDVKTETEIGFVALETSTNAVIIDVFRTGATLPGDKNNPAVANILGEAVDAGGYPVSQEIPVTTISVRNVIYGRPAYATIASYIAKRNSAAYTFNSSYSCDAGSLLFVGCDTSRVGPNQYEINYKFVHDPTTFHLRQVPRCDKNGKPIPALKNPVNVESESNPQVAAFVYYKQPFPNTAAFANLPLTV